MRVACPFSDLRSAASLAAALWLLALPVAEGQSLAPGAPVRVPDPIAELGALGETLETPRTLGLGLGARASATSTAAVALNPAGLSIGRNYHIEGSVQMDPQVERFGFGATLVDSFSGPVHAGASFRYIQGNGVSGPGGYDGRLSLSLPLGDSFGLGVTGRYVSFWREGSSNAPPFAEGITFDAAARVTPVAGLHIAAFGYNLIDLGSSLVPRQAGGSISYTYDNRLTLAFDGIADLGTFENPDGSLRPEGLFGGAGEYFTGEVPIRVGYYYDTGRDLHVLTGGLGYITEDFGVEVSLRQQVNRTQLTTILASFRYFVH
jgi:hypothetical protein